MPHVSQTFEPSLVAQVLMATHLKRTESVVQPALFRFEEHFELQALIGASRNSEVRRFLDRLSRRNSATRPRLQPVANAD